MGGKCSTYERREKILKKNWSENRRESDHAEDLGVDVKIKLECLLGKQGGKPPIQWVPGVLSPGVGRSVKLTTHLHPAPRLRMREDIPPLPNTSS
jgi:hypothetical protein